MILFVFEGVKREPDLFRTIQRLYFANRDEQIVCSYNNNIYQLYKDLQEYDGDGDIVSLLMEKFAGRADNPLKDIDASADISEIYLFFDYDFHNRNLPLEEINKQVEEMLEIFNNETEFGRLYIDYPMVESIRYTKQLPDANYWTYTVTRSECGKFKGVSADFSAYDSFDFILLKDHRESTEEEIAEIRQNWEHLKKQNVEKANYLCKNLNTMPVSKEDILQDKIFNSQVEKYVNTEDCRVAVLNAFPIFLFDYFK